MEHHHPIVFEEAADLPKELIVAIDANVFEHADRDDAVEGLGDVAIVLQSKFDPVGQVRLTSPLGRDGELLFG